MVEFNNSDDLKKWLEGKPREFSVVIASRAALRAVPVLSVLFDDGDFKTEYSSSIILPAFRAIALPLAAAKYPASRDVLVAYAADASAAATTAASTIASTAYVTSVGYTIASAMLINLTASDAVITAAASKGYAADAVAYAATSAVAYAAYSLDATHLEQGMAPEQLARHPLWEYGMPVRLIEHWGSLKKNLLALGGDVTEDWNQGGKDEDWNEGGGGEDWNEAENVPNWQVWTDWYENVLAGRNRAGLPDDLAEKLDLKIATKENEWWQRGPAKINRDIAAWTEEAREIAAVRSPDNQGDVIGPVAEPEPQNAGVVRFISQGGGPIGIYHAPEDALLNDKGAIDRHFEVRRLSEALIASFDPTEMGANSVAQLIEDVRNYCSALGETPGEANIDFLVPRGEGLRRLLLAQRNMDDLSDLPPISDKRMLVLEQLVGAHNIYVNLDPVLAKRDGALLGPDAKNNLISPKKGMQIVEDAVEADVAEPQVAEVLREEALVAPEIPDAEKRTSRRSSEGFKNFARQVVADVSGWIGNQALNHKKKVAKGVVTAALLGGIGVGGYKLGQWMLKNENWFMDSFSDKPVMLEIIREIFEILKKSPLG